MDIDRNRIRRNNILRIYMTSIRRSMTQHEMEIYLNKFHPSLARQPYDNDEFYQD